MNFDPWAQYDQMQDQADQLDALRAVASSHLATDIKERFEENQTSNSNVMAFALWLDLDLDCADDQAKLSALIDSDTLTEYTDSVAAADYPYWKKEYKHYSSVI